MPPNIRFDQPTGAGSGVAGQARTGLWLSQPIELHDVGSGMQSSRLWVLEGGLPYGSAASIATPTASVATFTPDVADTYLIRLQYDGFNDPDNPDFELHNKILLVRVTLSSTGGPLYHAMPLPAFVETDEHSFGISGQGPHALGGQGYYPLLVDLRNATMPGLTDLGNVNGSASFSGIGKRICKFTATGNVSLTLSNLYAGNTYTIRFKQDATGGRTLTIVGFTQIPSASFIPDPTANAETTFIFVVVGPGEIALSCPPVVSIQTNKVKAQVGNDLIIQAADTKAVIIRENNTDVFKMEDIANVSVMSGKGSTATQLESTTGPLRHKATSHEFYDGSTRTVSLDLAQVFANYADVIFDSSLTGAIIQHLIVALMGSAGVSIGSPSITFTDAAFSVDRFTITMSSSVSTFSGKGSSGTEINTASGDLKYRVPSTKQHRFFENTDECWDIDYDTPNSAGRLISPANIGWIEAGLLYMKASGTSARIVDPAGAIGFYLDTSGPILGDGVHSYVKLFPINTGFIHRSWGTGAGLHNEKSYYGMVQTTDATPTGALTVALPNGATGVRARVIACNADGSKMGDFRVEAGFRTSSGTTTIDSAATTTVITRTDAAYTASADAPSANNARITVTGKAATNLRWEVYADFSYGGLYV